MDQLRNVIQGGDMPQDLARELFERGATLVLKDFPEGCEFGVDCRSWLVGPKFLGLKMIPPGVHFFYMSVPGAPRIAFFHDVKPSEVILRKWDKQKEDLVNDESDELELERLRANLKNIDRNLGAYPYADFQQWASLSSHITPKTIGLISPSNKLGRISAQVEVTTMEAQMEQRLGDPHGLSIVDREHRGRIRFTDESGLPLMSENEESRLRFTDVPQITLADTNLKKAGIDSSDRFLRMLEALGSEHREVLAEFQFAFVVFLIGQVYEGFEQWKRIIHLLCSCTSALKSHVDFFNEFLMVFHYQMKMVPDDFFEDVLASNNFLATTLSLLFANIEDAHPANNSLRLRAMKFKALLERRFRKSFTLSNK